MGLIFSRKKPESRITEQDRSILQLKQQRDKLKQYQKRIESVMAADKELAKKLLHDGKKDRALLLLRKKRFQEQLLIKTDGQLENLSRLAHDLEFAQIEQRVIDGLRSGNEALKKINATMNIEEIEQILDETREGVEKQEEINALLTGVLTQDDEDAVNKEFEDMLRDETVTLEEATSGEPPSKNIEINLPDVPSEDVSVKVPKRSSSESEKVMLEA